jgi:hypothetical protein
MRMNRGARQIVLVGFLSVALSPLGAAQQERTESVGQGISVRVPENWVAANAQLRNGRELRAMKDGVVEARVLLVSEPRKNHAEALRRLQEIAAEVKAPVQYLLVAGWPAIQYRITAPLARTGQNREMSQKINKQDKEWSEAAETYQHSVTAIAAGDTVVRIDAELSPHGDAKLLDQAESMARNILAPQRPEPGEGEKELEQIRQNPITPKSPAPRAREPEGAAAQPKPSSKPVQTNIGAVEVQDGVGELEIAVSRDGNNVVIGANSGYSYSHDGGTTFTSGGSTPAPFPHDGDPSLGLGNSGNFYYGFIGYPDGSSGAKGVQGCAVGVSSSNDNGVTFPFLSFAAVCPETGAGLCFTDQPHITADKYNAGTGGDQIYSVWRNFTASGNPPNCGSIGGGFVTPEITCSADGGQTWTSPTVIGAGDFPRVSVGPDGSVYAAFRSGGSFLLNKFSSCNSGLVQQTGFPVTVTAFSDVVCPVPGLDRCNDGNVLSSPTVAVDESSSNHVFAAVANNTSPANEDIWQLESFDGGSTWGSPTTVNGAVTGRRYMPWICTTGSQAYVSWYDRRSATAANNDLTNYYVGTTGRFSVPHELNLSQNPDPECASGWPCGARSPNDYNSCSVQPQNGFVGGGCPKYGDYNGSACAQGMAYSGWASATAPPGVTAGPWINVFFGTFRPAVVASICVTHPWVCYGEPNLWPLDPWISIVDNIWEGEIQEIDVEQSTVLIQVTQAYLPQFIAGNLQGTIMASFRYASQLAVGDQFVFLANSQAGTGSVGTEIVGLIVPGTVQDLRTKIARASERVRAERLRHRVERADLVISGEVAKIEPSRFERGAEAVAATVRIAKVLKGDRDRKSVRVVFPKGVEARWVGVPRFAVGDKGVWILKRESPEREYKAPSFEDFLAPSQERSVEAVLQR